MARQLVTGGVNVGLISAAGTRPNLVGEAIAGIGAVLGEAYEKAQGKKKGIEKENEDFDKKLDEFLKGGTMMDEKELALETELASRDLDALEDEDTSDLDAILGTDKTTTAENITKPENNQTYTDRMAWNELNAGQKELLQKEQGITDFNQFTAAAEAWRNKNDPRRKNINIATDAEKRDQFASTPYDFIKGILKDTPIQRRRFGGQRSLANVFSPDAASTSDLVPTQGVPSDAISRGEKSQFTPGRTFIEKERRLSAPAWMGIGAAAVEGYNLGVEKRNYKKQVQADLQDYYSQEFAGLEAPETGVDYIDKSIQEVLMGEKKKLVNLLQEREQAFANGEGALWTSKYDDIKKAPQIISNVVEQYKGLKEAISEGMANDTFDFEAMSDEQIDELMSIAKGGAPIGIGNIEGAGLSLYGATRGGMPYLKTLSSFLGTGGPKAIEKKNAFDYVSGVVEQFRKNQDKYSKTVIDPVTKRKITVPMSMREITPYLMRMFDAELDSESATRAYASRSNWDDEGMTSEMFDASVKKGLDPKDFVKGKFLEAAQQMLQPYLAQYEETTTTESGAQFKASLKQFEETSDDREYSRGVDQLMKGIETIEKEVLSADFTKDFKKRVGEVNKKQYIFNRLPGLKMIEGNPNVGEIDVDNDTGEVFIYKPLKTTETTKDGETTTKDTEELLTRIDLKQDKETLKQQLFNLLKGIKYSPVSETVNKQGKTIDARSLIQKYSQQSNQKI